MSLDPTDLLTLAVSFSGLADAGFWTSVGVLAGTYTIFVLGLQLNVGYTGVSNFGQVGFSAIGAYTMAILVVDVGMSFWLSLPIAIAAAVLAGVLLGIPTLRLRTDYFAIVTVASAEAVRLVALNARDLTNGAQGIYGYDADWNALSRTIEGWLHTLGWSEPPPLMPLLLVVWLVALVLTFGLWRLQKTPWGRVLCAIREDEDAARALGKNAFAYKLQSLGISAGLGAVAGCFIALNLNFVVPEEFLPLVTFLGYTVLIIGGMANYWGVAVGAVIFWSVLEGLRFIDLPLEETQIAALRFMLVGLLLILLMAFRPQGLFGKREEMVLGD
jgi:branched-chain amino acid transport system permease protein